MSIFSVALTGLNAAQVGILTTNHNIANTSTEGYNRQQIIQSTNTPMFTGAGYIGQGTNVLTVRRIYDQQLNEQVLAASTGAAEMDSYLAQIGQIDNLLADPSAGLTPALSSFFSAVQEMAANPASIPARQGMLSASQALVARFQSIDQRMTEIRSGVNAMVTSEVTAINSYAQQIAEINERIILAQAAGPNQPPNDLLDQRDQLVAELNTKIRATTITQSDGTYSVFIGNGQPLVIGTLPYSMKAVAAPDDPERIVVALTSPNGSSVYMPESMLTGGSLGGLIAFRSQSLDDAQNALGRIALTLAQNFNDQHQLGQDLDGDLGGNYFDTSLMGATIRSNANNVAPAGTVTVAISDYGALTTSDYRLTSNGGGNYTLVRLSDNAVLVNNAALPATIDGMAISVAGGPAANNSYLIQPTRGGATNLALAIGNPRDIAVAAPIRTSAALANTGTGGISAGTVNPSLPLDANLRQTVTITFTSATTYDVTGTGTGLPATGLTYTPGDDITYNGWTIQINGAPAANDVFTIERNSAGVADNRNGVLLGALQTKSTMEGGTANYLSAYSTIVAQIGNKAREVEITGQAQQSLLEQAQSTRDQLSGVNLDEEAANLLRYQQAYQAAAKVISIATTLFDEILALGR
ncbi:MAG: flagellar hook-associated protein FlgK [Pseudomonadota bacterium]